MLAKFCIRLLVGAWLLLTALALLFPRLVDSDTDTRHAPSAVPVFKPSANDSVELRQAKKAYPDQETNIAEMDTLRRIQERH